MSKIVKLPRRDKVKPSDTWDLAKLFSNDQAWEAGLSKLERKLKGYRQFRGTLGQSPAQLAQCLRLDSAVDRLAERLGNYAFLKSAEDQANSAYQRMVGRYQSVATRASEAASFIRPELMALPVSRYKRMLAARELKPYRLLLERLLRHRPHTLSHQEEKLLAMQGEMADAPEKIFRQLHDADLTFGLVNNERGERIELTPATFQQLLQSPRRAVRRTAFHQFYDQFQAHQHTLAASLAGSVQTDVYYARARGYDSCLQKALFPDRVPQAVYDHLIATVRRHLPTVFRYYDLRRRKMRLREIHHYDTYVPILSKLETRYTWDQAVAVVVDALHPLGSDYCDVLRRGLNGRWCDRYPNQGKRSGAFSSGTFDGDPYIMMNYQPTVLNHVFTLAHEAGHSMHTCLSARHQPFEYYRYTIFVAEVASTFNEQLLSHHMLRLANSDQQRAYLINNQIDDIRATIVRQTMFAEFERQVHQMVEAGEPLTVDSVRTTYGQLLQDYFGPDFVIDDQLSLECLRIPHFYRAFYVYKYATGLSAAIALSRRVLEGTATERDAYLGFLQGGCSKYPLDLLRDAGVDLEKPHAVQTAMVRLAELIDQLEQLL